MTKVTLTDLKKEITEAINNDPTCAKDIVDAAVLSFFNAATEIALKQRTRANDMESCMYQMVMPQNTRKDRLERDREIKKIINKWQSEHLHRWDWYTETPSI